MNCISIKYLDECHFDGRDCKIRYARGKKGERVCIPNYTPLNERVSVTLLTSLTDNIPVYFDIRESSNTQFDFFGFVISAITAGRLIAGDILIYDNATIHLGNFILEPLDIICRVFDIKIVRLPTYSPELRACTSCLKKKVYKLGIPKGVRLWEYIVLQLSQVTRMHMLKWYLHCMYKLNE